MARSSADGFFSSYQPSGNYIAVHSPASSITSMPVLFALGGRSSYTIASALFDSLDSW